MQRGVPPLPTAVRLSVAIVAAVLVGVLGAADLLSDSRTNLPILYPALLLASLWVRDLRYLWILVAACVALTAKGYSNRMEEWSVLINRALVIAVIVAVGASCDVLLRTWRRLQRGHHILRQQADALEATNAELATREEEVARQNEELQSTAEELERQSEELRLANEELAAREWLLEHLLALSRSLSVELSRDQVMSLVCEALGFLMTDRAAAAAILVRRGADIAVECHHGFGAGGINNELIAERESLAALVFERNELAYVEDLSLRPDLRIPQPVEGQPMLSVLAAPLRVRGRPVGSLEVYSRQRGAWSQEQVGLMESLAAQASISLEAAEAFEEVEQERRRFMAVFRTLPVGVAVASADGTQIQVNPAGAAMLNVPVDANIADTIVRGHWQAYRAAQSLVPDQSPLLRALRGGTETSGEEQALVFSDGRRLTVLVSAAPIRARDGSVVGAVSAFADITRIKRLEQELDRRRREAEEAAVRKTRFLAAVSHDIRTPANAINLLAELIRRSAINPAMASEVPLLAGELQASATSLVNLVTDVLDLARFDAGKVELNESEFELGAEVADEIRQLQPLASTKSLQLRYDPPSAPLRVICDRTKVGRVIANLLGNAIKFTDHGQITVSVWVEDGADETSGDSSAPGSVKIRIADTGVGIPREHLPRIFDEFFQLRNPARDPHKGAGLGLTICKQLLDALGGSVQVQSEPGQGAVFTVTLPASCRVRAAIDCERPESAPAPTMSSANASALAPSSPAGASPSDSSPAARELGSAGGNSRDMAGLRVLLVEDHATTRVATAQLLRAEGADVLVASDGATAIRLLQQFEPDVLLLDMMLPDMSGADVLRSMSTANASRPAGSVIVMTGDLTADRLDEIRSLGADVFLPKPVVLDELLAHLRGLAAVATSVAATPVSAAPSAARSGASVAASDEDDSPGNGQRSAKARSPVPDSSAGSDP